MLDDRFYDTFAYVIYAVLLLLLFLTIFNPHEIKGSRSWIVLGPLRLQPAEFAKFATALAVSKLMSTVYGAYFNHESETAGLGAEIKDNQKWQEKFQGKKLFKDGNRNDIALSVNKEVTDPSTQVDAVTGATLTSNGVANMLHDGLGKFLKFLNSK